MKKKFKILSIDGGGIKGLYSATILKKFEEKFNCKTADHFDMICGTSTGGLIALALSIGMSAKEICEFYETKGEFIFPNQIRKLPLGYSIDIGFFKQVLFKGKYKDEELKKALIEIFEDKKIKDCKNLLNIPSFSLTKGKPKVFKRDHSHLRRDIEAPIVDIALATSAAPTYFPLAESVFYDNEQFIDGGVWANNPTLVGVLESLKYFVGSAEDKEYDSIEVLSLSSLSKINGEPTGIKRRRSFRHWKDSLFDTSMRGQDFFTNFFMEQLKEVFGTNIMYYRIPSPIVRSKHESLIELDVANRNAFDLMKIYANEQALNHEKKKEIIKMFTEKKTYII